MDILTRISVLLVLLLVVTESLPDVWNPDTCAKGCNDHKKCPKNQDCRPIENTNCGVCVCSQGYKQSGQTCVVDKSQSGNNNNNANCNKGCNDKKKCPQNQICNAPQDGSNCGECGCDSGYKLSGQKCIVDNSAPKSTASTSTASTSTSTSTTLTSTSSSTSTSTSTTASTSTTTTTTTTAKPTQGPPPAPIPLDCSSVDCGVRVDSTENASNPLSVRTQKLGTPPPGCSRQLNRGQVVCKTPLASGDNSCYGAYCMPVSDSKSYCVCSFDKSGPACQEDKRGSCSSASGQLNAKGFQTTGKRFIHQSDPDNGAIFARHFTTSIGDCIKLCQMSKGQCGSLNFGQLNGQNICELLSVEAKKENTLLNAWVKDAPGWTYACCFMNG